MSVMARDCPQAFFEQKLPLSLVKEADMKRRNLFLFLIAVLTMLFASIDSVSAQDLDVSDLSNEQLIQLLQAIMQKLDEDETEETQEPEPAEPEPASAPVQETTPVPETEIPQFQLYLNKKLTLERIPDDRFIQKPKDDGNDDNHNGKKDKDTSKKFGDIRDCLDPCYSSCAYHDWVCMEKCYTSCGGK